MSGPRRRRLRRRVAGLLTVAAVTALHAWLLLGRGEDAEPPPDPAASVAVQLQALPPRPAAPPPAPAPVKPVARPAPKAAREAAAEKPAAPVVAEAASAVAQAEASSAPDVAASEPHEVALALPAAASEAQSAAAASEPLPGATAEAAPEAASAVAGAASAVQGALPPLPVYATALPPPLLRRYRLERGLLWGTGELRWRPGAGQYEASLTGEVAGINVLDWRSTGALDGAGIAPERYLVRRRGREAQAANFQREDGKITYSGPTTEFPLPAGAQDRLSVLLQIPAIVAADPQRFGAGERIQLFVTGARGDADAWTFVVEGEQTVAGPAGEVRSLKLSRQPRKKYDTRVEIWLDPARHHLPVRARLSAAGGGDALEMVLESEEREP
ncbi:DUF3108 domain-containing protein [Azohydromonas australica]|uniref:DUF3108 domain-containing protein n=1 Tax=Azohydromonas australica TaxID=364039 RepID=UPI00048EB936|nr:DUF3108 domain-containing protein [Azohydromonas australica]